MLAGTAATATAPVEFKTVHDYESFFAHEFSTWSPACRRRIFRRLRTIAGFHASFAKHYVLIEITNQFSTDAAKIFAAEIARANGLWQELAVLGLKLAVMRIMEREIVCCVRRRAA